MDTIKLYSWNVNGLRAVLRKGALQNFLEKAKPDVLCLQEIKCRPDQLTPADLLCFDGYQIFWNPADRPGYSGTATLVRANMEASRCEVRPQAPDAVAIKNQPDFSQAKENLFSELSISEGRILTLDLGDFYLVNVYTPNSKNDLSRLSLRYAEWDPMFKDYLRDLEKQKPVVACGDFNAAHQEIDLARPDANHKNAGFTDEERKGITRLLSVNFLDTFRLLHPDSRRYSWWSHWGKARINNVGWRIDYFFISASLKPRLCSADIHEAVLGSDHCPVSITLELK